MNELTRVLAASVPLPSLPESEPPTEFPLFGFGAVRARWMGGTEATFTFDRAAAERVMQHYRDRGRDLGFDYNHRQTSEGAKDASDHELRSAGSFELELRDDGLWLTNIRWTADADRYIRAREYRYLSPAFNADKSGRIVEIHNIALTPNPATLGAVPLVADVIGDPMPPEAGRDEDDVEFGELIGLAAGAPSADVALRATALANFEGAVLAALNDAPDRETAMERLETLAASAARADELGERVRVLEGAAEDAKREQLITAALGEGKLTAGQVSEGAWARTAPIEVLESFLASAPRVVPLTQVEEARTGSSEDGGTKEFSEAIRRQAKRNGRR